MANNTLRERLLRGRMDPVKALDAIILLGSWLFDAEYQNGRDSFEEISPDTVEFDADGLPRLRRRQGPGPSVVDLAYLSPARVTGQARPCLEEDWFSLGMAAAHMMTGTDPYQALPDGIFSVGDVRSPRFSLQDADGYDPQIIAAVEGLMGPDPAQRGACFGSLVDRAMDKYPCELIIVLICDGAELQRARVVLNKNRIEYRLPASFTQNGETFLTGSPTFQYRPGRHTCRLNVRRQGGAGSGSAGGASVSQLPPGRWLLLRTPSGWTAVLRCGQPQAGKCVMHVALDAGGYEVVACELNSGSHRVLGRWTVCASPASTENGSRQGILQFLCPAGGSRVSVALFDEAGSRRLAAATIDAGSP